MNATCVARSLFAAMLAAFLLASPATEAAAPRATAAKPISKVLGVRLPAAKAGGVCSLPVPNLVVFPSPVSIPATLRQTTSAPVPFAIQNTGTGNLVVAAMMAMDPPGCDCPQIFDVIDTNGCVGASIPPGGICTAYATFFAFGGTGQTWGGSIEIVSNDPAMPISSWPLEGTIGLSQLALSAPSLDFGATPAVPPTPVQLPLGLTNAGNLTLNVSGVSLSGSGSVAYSVAPSANCAPYGASFPLTLPVGASCDLTVTFAPPGIGIYSNVALFVNFSNGVNSSSEFARFTGVGTGTGGSLAFTPSSVNFGYLPVGQVSFSELVTVTNLDTVPLALSGFVVAPPYVADFSDCVAASPLQPLATCDVALHVDASSAAAGDYPESLEITANAVQSFLPLSVTVQPNLSFNPSSHDFGDVPVGSTPSQAFVLENFDPAPYSFSLSSPGSAFTLTGGTCLGGTVPASPGGGVPGTCTVDVQFAPSSSGPAQDYFYAVEPVTNTYVYVDLYGNGIVPGARLQLSPDIVSFPPGPKDTPVQVAVVATNVGDAPTPTGLAFLSDNPEVTVDPGTCAVQVGSASSCTFIVQYSRASVFLDPWNLAYLTVQGTEGLPTHYADLYVYGNTVAATPAAIEAAPSGTVPFAATLVGSASAPVEISLGNTGGGTATLDIVSIVSDSPEFVLTTDCPIAAPLSGQACCLATVTFQPAAAGARNGTLTVDTTAGILTIFLTGLGVATLPPEVAMTLTPPSVAIGAPSTLTVSLSNMNDIPLTGVGFLHSLPAGMQVAATPAVTNTCGGTFGAVAGGPTLTLSGATIPAGMQVVTSRASAKATQPSTCSVSVSVIGTQAGVLVTTIPAGAVTSIETSAAGVSTLEASATLTVGGPTPLPAALSFTPGTVAPGVASRFVLNVGNPNPAAFVDPDSFTYVLPSGVVIANPSSAGLIGTACSGAISSAAPGATSFTLTGFGVATGGGCDFQVDVVASAPGTYPATLAAGAISGFVLSEPVGNAAPAISPVSLTVSAAPAPVLALTPPAPGTIDFGQVTVGASSSPWPILVANTGNAPLAFSGAFAVTGDYALSSNLCGTTLAVPPDPASSCVANLVFSPGATGIRGGSFTVASNGGNATLNLTGEGLAQAVPTIALSTASIVFASQTVGTTSAPQQVVVTSAGTAPLEISGVTVGGDFAVATPCTALSPLAPSATCAIDVTFTPVFAGTRVGQVTIASNDPGAPASVVSLSGTASAAPAPNVSLSPSTLAFPTTSVLQASAPLSATLTNTGAAALAIQAVELVGTGFRLSGDCSGRSLATGETCLVTAVFAPPASGNYVADVRILSNAPAGAAFLKLTGSATPAPTGRFTAVPAVLSFGDQVVGTSSAALPFTVTNTGAAVASVTGIAVTGDFSIEGACYDVRPGESCAFLATFAPSAIGARSGQVVITSDASNSPFAVGLSGTGVPVPAPRVQLSASVLAWGNTLTGSTSTQVLTVTNVGALDLTIGTVQVTGDFRVDDGCTGTVAPGRSCRIEVGFMPTIPGIRTGEVSISTNAEGSPHQVGLSGTGCRLALFGRNPSLTCR